MGRWTCGLVAMALGLGCAQGGDGTGEDTGEIEAGLTDAAWAPGTAYAAGASVTFDGRAYVCRQAHTAQPGWEPPAAPALWASPAPLEDGAPWAAQTSYAVGARVTYGGQSYTCRQGHVSLTGWEPPSTPALWDASAQADYTEWPNPVSRANSDPWLVANHDRVEVVRPRLLVLLYANPGTAESETDLVQRITRGLSEGSRPRGYADPAAAPQIEYRITVRDLRDGVDGRPPPPAGYPYENSTLYPRKPEGSPGWGFDYARFFTQEYARYLGYPDPSRPGEYLDLCALVERGDVHEVWAVGSSDVPDVNAAEVLGMMPRYTADGHVIPGEVNRCSGNGCFDPEVPYCGRSLRIGWVNYTRGPGCYLHNQGHGIEFGVKDSVPALAEWFTRFAGFDYERYGLPFPHLYALGCAEPPCYQLESPSRAHFVYGTEPYDVEPFDPVCGNVHFPPNGVSHYDYFNPQPVLTSCPNFGRGGESALIDPSAWARYGEYGDCGGEFLVWWYQNMPGFGSGQTFADGRPMRSMWPFLYY